MKTKSRKLTHGHTQKPIRANQSPFGQDPIGSILAEERQRVALLDKCVSNYRHKLGFRIFAFGIIIKSSLSIFVYCTVMHLFGFWRIRWWGLKEGKRRSKSWSAIGNIRLATKLAPEQIGNQVREWNQSLGANQSNGKGGKEMRIDSTSQPTEMRERKVAIAPLTLAHSLPPLIDPISEAMTVWWIPVELELIAMIINAHIPSYSYSYSARGQFQIEKEGKMFMTTTKSQLTQKERKERERERERKTTNCELNFSRFDSVTFGHLSGRSGQTNSFNRVFFSFFSSRLLLLLIIFWLKTQLYTLLIIELWCVLLDRTHFQFSRPWVILLCVLDNPPFCLLYVDFLTSEFSIKEEKSCRTI